MVISPLLITQLRESTGYSLADCKHALEQTNGNLEKASALLRQNYASKYSLDNINIETEQKTVVAVFFNSEKGTYGYCLVRTESDVSARSEILRDLIAKAFELIDYDTEDTNGFSTLKLNDDFKASYENILTTFGESIVFEKIQKKHLGQKEFFAHYHHNDYYLQEDKSIFTISQSAAPLVLKYDGDLDINDIEKVEKLAHAISITMIASGNAHVFFEHELDPILLDNFKKETMETLTKMGKPKPVVEKILQGQINKFLQENVLMYQPLLTTRDIDWFQNDENDEVKIVDAIEQTERRLNCKISVAFYKVLIGN